MPPGCLYCRLEEKLQQGTPDIMIFGPTDYLLIEAKILRKKALTDIVTDLKWQPGQLAFMADALKYKLPYALLVGKEKNFAFFIGDYHVARRGILYAISR